MQYYKNIESFVDSKAVFCGIDVHKRQWSLCFVCDGEVIESIHMGVDYSRLRSILERYSSGRVVKFVYEAGFSGFWLYRRLTQDGYHCIVTPPNKMHKSGDKVKTDKRDAQTLASYLAAGLLKAVWVPPQDVESDRRVIRRRGQLMKEKKRIQCQIKSLLHLHGITRPAMIKKNWSNAYLLWLASIQFVNHSDKFTLTQLLKSYRRVRTDLAEVTRHVRLMSRWPQYERNFKHLTSLRGVGLITAMTFLLEIYDFGRFKTTDDFSSYLGLTPSQYSTGDKVRLGHITRQGNAHLRHVLVESAWTVVRHDPVLREKYQRIHARDGSGKRAIVAVARSLAVRLRRCLLDDTDYVAAVC